MIYSTKFEYPNTTISLFSRISSILSIAISILCIFASCLSILDVDIYGALLKLNKISENLYYGSIAQDIVILPVSIILLLSTVFYFIKRNIKFQVFSLGLVWCEFYAFGLYTIQGQYTSIYPIYLGIFSLSIFSLIFGIIGINKFTNDKLIISKRIRVSIAIFLIFIIMLMIPIWILRMIPSVVNNLQPETYGVFVLDLGLVFPAIAIIAIMLLRNYGISIILSGIAIIKTMSLCLTWAFAELYVAIVRKIPVAVDMISISSLFTIIGFLFAIVFFSQLRVKKLEE